MTAPAHAAQCSFARAAVPTAPYAAQAAAWPTAGRHILAHHDAEHVVVYQAYNAAIAGYAVAHQTFAGCPQFSTTRMTWVKTNFMWMAYRCGWCSKDANQARVLQLTVTRAGFDELLRRSVNAFRDLTDLDEPAFKAAFAASDVRLQWDPDHSPCGGKLARRAVQLGMKGEAARLFLAEWLVGVVDVTDGLVLPQQHAALKVGAGDVGAWAAHQQKQLEHFAGRRKDINQKWQPAEDDAGASDGAVTAEPAARNAAAAATASSEEEGAPLPYLSGRARQRAVQDARITATGSGSGNDDADDGDAGGGGAAERAAERRERERRYLAVVSPIETLYRPRDEAVARHIWLDAAPSTADMDADE
jgi:hypothetical protein